MRRPSRSSGSGGARFRAAAARRYDRPADTDGAVGAMIGTFVGDALGMPWEGSPGAEIPYELEMRDARLGRGTYTDDTQMMIGVAESLLRHDLVDESDLAETFLSLYDARRGYGEGTTRVLDLWKRGIRVEEAASRVFHGRGSLGNGAAMRVAPLAVRFFDDSVLLATQVRRSARVTHAHPVGIDGAEVQAAAIAAALDGEDPMAAAVRAARTREVRAAIVETQRRTDDGLTPESLGSGRGVPPTADATVAAAVVAATQADSFEAAVTVAIRAGGDTDTAGAMTGAIAGARFGAAAIPARWVETLEEGHRGRRHVEQLATRLAERTARATTAPLPGRQR